MSFTVTTDRLEALASEIDSLSSSFEDVAQRRVAYAGYSDARHVEDGLNEFFRNWTDGMESLHSQLSNLASQLHGAAGAYDATEQQISDAASGG
jgi:uncharacterized protein YukE